jgi:hypothetical protein
MPKKASLLETIALRGLEIAPSQVWGAIRIVPLLRRQVRYDLRLWQRQYRDDAAIVSLTGDLKYMSYVPHGLVLSWSDDGSPVAAFGGQLYTAGPFSLQRFITDLHLKDENHIGEAIVRDNGELEYLKTYRLSAAQTRRVYLLSQLAACGWQLDRAAERLGNTREDFVLRLEKAGFGYLLNNQLLERARKYQRQSHNR